MLLRLLFTAPWIFAVASGRMVLHERATAPVGFISMGSAAANKEITLRVALAANNIGGLQEKLLSIATPGSSDFRQWLSAADVKAFVQPSQETLSAFNAFTSTNNLTSTVISPNGDWMSITLPVSHANTLFNAQFEEFAHSDLGNTTITRTLSVSLPAELVGHVDVLHPTTAFFSFPQPRLSSSTYSRSSRAVDDSCDTSVGSGTITPTCLQELYGIPSTPATSAGNSIGVTGYVGQSVDAADVAAFLELARPDIPPNTTFSVVGIDGGVNQPGGGMGEASLDIEYTIGLATGVPVQFLTVPSTDATFNNALLDTTTFLDGVENPPTVLSTSYAATESVVGSSLATKICNGYMALGARGMSILFASGDGGPRTVHDKLSQCTNNTFEPIFPASCPWVTAVGGTFGTTPEIAANFSGGGFSNFFPAPAYQSAEVTSFVAGLPADFPGIFNKSGRGFPDVALQGWNFQVVVQGAIDSNAGTSASTPAWASVVALLNDRLIAAGKPVLGFLNPFLYHVARSGTGFTDITAGHNSGASCPASSVAFDAVVGWDPLTGVGTPKFEELLAAAMA